MLGEVFMGDVRKTRSNTLTVQISRLFHTAIVGHADRQTTIPNPQLQSRIEFYSTFGNQVANPGQ